MLMPTVANGDLFDSSENLLFYLLCTGDQWAAVSITNNRSDKSGEGTESKSTELALIDLFITSASSIITAFVDSRRCAECSNRKLNSIFIRSFNLCDAQQWKRKKSSSLALTTTYF